MEKKLKFGMLVLFIGFGLAIGASNDSKADMPLPSKEGGCGFCLQSDGNWGADIDCWNGTNICVDSGCLYGWC